MRVTLFRLDLLCVDADAAAEYRRGAGRPPTAVLASEIVSPRVWGDRFVCVAHGSHSPPLSRAHEVAAGFCAEVRIVRGKIGQILRVYHLVQHRFVGMLEPG